MSPEFRFDIRAKLPNVEEANKLKVALEHITGVTGVGMHHEVDPVDAYRERLGLPEELHLTIGALITRARMGRFLSSQQLAVISNVSVETVEAIERGRIPQRVTLAKIAVQGLGFNEGGAHHKWLTQKSDEARKTKRNTRKLSLESFRPHS